MDSCMSIAIPPLPAPKTQSAAAVTVIVTKTAEMETEKVIVTAITAEAAGEVPVKTTPAIIASWMVVLLLLQPRPLLPLL